MPHVFTEAVTPRLIVQARLGDESVRVWRASAGRPYDTFIGLTDLISGTFHMRPCVSETADRGIYASLFLYRDRARVQHKFRTSKIAAESYYGVNNIVVVPYELAGNPQGVDGFAHSTLCNRVGVSGHDALGWAIKGNAGGQGVSRTGEMAFSSGRNIGKFPAVARPAGQAGRDLPSPWAQFVLNIIARDLHVSTGAFAVDQRRWPGVD